MAQDPAGGVISTGGLTGSGTAVMLSPFTFRRDPAGTWTPLPDDLGVFKLAAVLDARAGRVVRTGGTWFGGAQMTQALGASGWETWAPEMNRQPIAIAYEPNRGRISTWPPGSFSAAPFLVERNGLERWPFLFCLSAGRCSLSHSGGAARYDWSLQDLSWWGCRRCRGRVLCPRLL